MCTHINYGSGLWCSSPPRPPPGSNQSAACSWSRSHGASSFLGGGVDYRCSTDGLVTDQWTGWMAGWWSPFFLPRFPCPDEGHVGGWVEGIREEARVKGMVVVVVVVEQGGVCV